MSFSPFRSARVRIIQKIAQHLSPSNNPALDRANWNLLYRGRLLLA
jgi:hypothetical protein